MGVAYVSYSFCVLWTLQYNLDKIVVLTNKNMNPFLVFQILGFILFLVFDLFISSLIIRVNI